LVSFVLYFSMDEKSLTEPIREPEMHISREILKLERIPIEWRDFCAHFLIPLDHCRRETLFMPWKCHQERHAYEKCQYEDWLRRMEKARKD